MSAGTMERERGDDRDPEIAKQKMLEEMLSQPAYVSDTPNAAAGEYAPLSLHNERLHGHPVQLGHIALRRVHIMPSMVLLDVYQN